MLEGRTPLTISLKTTMSHPDNRYRVDTPSHREWNLIINSVNTSDQGQYACQVNTNPVKKKLVMLHVKGEL